MTKIKAFFASEKGAALVEYGILVGLIAVLALGEQVQSVFTTVTETLDSNLSTALSNQ